MDWIKDRTLDREKINIGLCHGSIKNEAFPGNSFPIENDFAIKQGLDYLALGDWHSYKQINERTFYPGVPEPLTFDDNGAVLKVTIAGPGKKPTVEPVPIESKFKWKRMEEQVFGDTFNLFKAKLEKTDEKEIRKLTVSGYLPLGIYKSYKELLERNRRHYIEIKDNVIVQPDEQAFLDAADGCMKEIIKRLFELKKSGEPLPDEILNPYVSLERTEVHKHVDELKNNRDVIIDKALLEIFNYLKEKK